jgi:diamine N-acetyltransferase
MNRNFTPGEITFRPTVEEDLNVVLQMEQNPENSQFIRQWPREKHIAAIGDKNILHMVVCACDDIVGYLILIGILDADRSIEFKRMVIGNKGRGYGRESLHFVKRTAFEDLNTHRLWLEVVENNERAYSLYLSEGFIEEGIHRESLKQGENYVSLRVMSVLEHEYRSMSEGKVL